MLIERTGYFYAAHRNERLHGDKCFALHGHTYYVTAAFEVGDPRDSGVTVLFAELESALDSVLNKLDHGTLVHEADQNLVDALRFLETQDGGWHKQIVFDKPTSAEHVAEWIFAQLEAAGVDVEWVKVKETQSSTVVWHKAKNEIV
tara:strand:+ start:4840 stop:5277 length:438 start_codon:yes stop_codon:yes gene_type:complete